MSEIPQAACPLSSPHSCHPPTPCSKERGPQSWRSSSPRLWSPGEAGETVSCSQITAGSLPGLVPQQRQRRWEKSLLATDNLAGPPAFGRQCSGRWRGEGGLCRVALPSVGPASPLRPPRTTRWMETIHPSIIIHYQMAAFQPLVRTEERCPHGHRVIDHELEEMHSSPSSRAWNR